jgi:hypothetical protein
VFEVNTLKRLNPRRAPAGGYFNRFSLGVVLRSRLKALKLTRFLVHDPLWVVILGRQQHEGIGHREVTPAGFGEKALKGEPQGRYRFEI